MQHIVVRPTATFFSLDTEGGKTNKNVEPKREEK